MNLSLFNIILRNKKYEFTFNNEKSNVIQEIKYFIDELYTDDPFYLGELTRDKFVLKKTKKPFKVPLDFSYKVFGVLKKRENNCVVSYRTNINLFFLKHSSVCIVPTLMLLFIFTHYKSIYLLIPLLYFLISDFLFNLITLYHINKQYNYHFNKFLKMIETRLRKKK